VHVHSLVHPANTKVSPVAKTVTVVPTTNKLASPVAKTVTVKNTVLLVPIIVCWMPQVVQLVPMPVELAQFVILAVVENTMNKLGKYQSQVAKTAPLDSIKI
jgi:hypothetical protein